MQCLHPYKVTVEGNSFNVPCGKCIPCKIKVASNNAMRCLMELSTTPDYAGIFLTLTYNDEHLPDSLQVSDLQGFWKRLRRDLPDLKFKYFACGEYGDKFGRPHYHAILFGFPFHYARCAFCTSHSGKFCRHICENWCKGNVYLGSVTYQSCRYVASYIQKKYFGDKSNVEYGDKRPPFQCQSQGIGFDYFLSHLDQISEYGLLCEDHVVGVPRAFVQKLKRDIIHGKIEVTSSVRHFLDTYREKVWQMPELNKVKSDIADLFYSQYSTKMFRAGKVLSPVSSVKPTLSEVLRGKYNNYVADGLLDGVTYQEFEDEYLKLVSKNQKYRTNVKSFDDEEFKKFAEREKIS